MLATDIADTVPDDPIVLADEIASLAAHLDAATHRLLACIRGFDESGEWERQGLVSCAHWLSWRIGLDPGTAREKVRVARALGALPRIDEALRRGGLSYAKVRAITRVATPENEERLLEIALATTGAQLERVCRRFRRVVDVVEGERLDERRFVRDEVLSSGLVRITAVLQPDEAALVMKAIEAARVQMRPADVPAEAPSENSSPMLSAPDALTRVAESFLAHGEAEGRGGDRYQIVVHLDQDPLAADGDLAANLDDGTRLSAETFRRIACDAGLVPMRRGSAGETIDVGRRTRTISPALRRALEARDHGCQFPGCTNHLYVHAHHIQHWAHGGATSPENLVLLCSAHHRMVHEGGFRVSRSGGRIEFHDAHGRRLDRYPAPAALEHGWRGLRTWTGSGIDQDTNFPAWDGTPVDYDAVLSALWECR